MIMVCMRAAAGRKVMGATFFAILGLAASIPTSAALAAPPAPSGSCTQITKNTVVSTSTTFCSKTYKIADKTNNGVIIVRPSGSATSGVTVNGNGAILQGLTNQGYGIWVDNSSTVPVTIEGFNISGYYYGVRVEGYSNVTIQNNTISNNYASKVSSFDINASLSSAYGGGILLNGVTNSVILGNMLQNESTGVDSYSSNGNTIKNNNTSHNTAWGVRLYSSSSNVVDHNTATNDEGAWDTAGMLVTNASNNNTVTNNNLTYSGDGFFLGNQYSLTSNGNLVQGNDGSYSPHNCFEATFGDGNRFINNIAKNCDYGFWLGYARDAVVQDNIVQNNTADGIAIPTGCVGTFTHNILGNNGQYGFWASGAPSSDSTWPCSSTTNNHLLTSNTIDGNISAGVYLGDTTNTVIGGSDTTGANQISANPQGIYVAGASSANSAHNNDLTCATSCTFSVYNAVTGVSLDATSNWWGGTTPAVYGVVDTSSPLSTQPSVTKPTAPTGVGAS